MTLFRSRPVVPVGETTLSVEELEERQMLSTVEIFAAGSEGFERMRLRVDNQFVAGYTVGGDPSAREFERFVYTSSEPIDITQIKIEFANDRFDPEAGIDTNLFVDKIILDDVVYETENERTYSSAYYTDQNGVAPGRYATEELNVEGGFRYSRFGASLPETRGTEVGIRAVGSTGDERFALRIDGEVVQEFNMSDGFRNYFSYQSDQELTADQIQVEFLNDLFDEETGVDRNLDVFEVDLIDPETGVRDRISSETATIFSTGTWTAEDGVVPGFGRGRTLHANGYFQYSVPTEGPDLEEALNAFDERLGGNSSPVYWGETFVDSQGRTYRLATASGVAEVMIVRVVSNGDNRLDPAFADNGVRYLQPGDDTQYQKVNRLIFDSNDNIGMAFNVTKLTSLTSGGSAGAVYQYDFEGTTLIKLDSSGNFDSSFGDGDGVAFIPNTNGENVMIPVESFFGGEPKISFDQNDNFVISGSQVGTSVVALRNNIPHSSFPQATLRFNGESFDQI